MCVKNISVTMKQYYALLMTSPKLASPVVLQTFQKYPTHQQINEIGEPHLQKNRDWSLLVHFDEQPQLHVIPIHVPVMKSWIDDEMEEYKKIPLLPVKPKTPYLA
jgi:hypothetical protein